MELGIEIDPKLLANIIKSPLIPEKDDEEEEDIEEEKDKVIEEVEESEESQVYFARDIQRALGLGKSKTYEYLEEVCKSQSPFRVIKIGRLFRIPKKSFDEWINAV